MDGLLICDSSCGSDMVMRRSVRRDGTRRQYSATVRCGGAVAVRSGGTVLKYCVWLYGIYWVLLSVCGIVLVGFPCSW